MDRYGKTGPRVIPIGGEEQFKRDAEARMRERDARVDDRTEADRPIIPMLTRVAGSLRHYRSAAQRADGRKVSMRSSF